MASNATVGGVIACARKAARDLRAKAELAASRFRQAQFIAGAESLEALADAFDPPHAVTNVVTAPLVPADGAFA